MAVGDDPNPSVKIISGPPAPPRPLSSHYHRMGAEFTARRTIPEAERVKPPLHEMLYIRYGFYVSAVASDLRSGVISLDPNTLTLDEVASVLMEKYGTADKASKDAVRYIVTRMQREGSILAKYWDLHPNSPEPLRLQSPRHFRFAKMVTHLEGDKTQILEGFEVSPTNLRYWRNWTIVLGSPIAVTHCIRDRWGPSLEDVVEKAVGEGYSIHVLRYFDKRQLLPRSEPPVLFGRRERPQGFEATQEDYAAFLSVVEELMQQPRFVSAVFRGGILGRICFKFVHLEDLLEGPSSDAEKYGLRWIGPGNGQDCWVEDYVSEEEIELLIGMFYVATDRPKQFAKKSFFPSPNAWKKSGLNTRVWSNFAEEKYKLIVRTATESDGANGTLLARLRLRSTAEWKSHLRLFRNKTENFLRLVESEAQDVIRNRGI